MSISWNGVSPIWRWRLLLLLLAAVVVVLLAVSPKPWIVAAKAGDKWDTLDYVRVYSWAAGVINVIVLCTLSLLCPWWATSTISPLENRNSKIDVVALRPGEAAWRQSVSLCSAENPQWFWPVVWAAMLIASLFGLPRLHQGFWDDEDLNVRTTLYGRFKPKGDHEMEFRKFDWLETVYGYKKGPNSHTLSTICARACEDVWTALFPARSFPLVEWPFRLPSLIFGVLAVGALAWMLADFRLPVAGAIAAGLLAIHPWHIRYASEARGYSLMICLVPLVLVCWRRAMVTGTWKWWAAFAAAQFALIYCYPGALFILVLINAISLPVFFFSQECAGAWRDRAGRWFFVNAVAGMLAIQLMLPLFPQARAYFDFVASQGFVAGKSWMINTACFMLGGAPWTKSGDPALGYPEWLAAYSRQPVLFEIASCLAIAFVLIGAAVLLRRGWAPATLVAVTFLCPPITFLVAMAKKFLLYECYIIYALPSVVALAAVGLYFAGKTLSKVRGGPALGAAFVALILAADFAYTMPYRDWIVAHPLQQMRESVIACRGTLDPKAPGARQILTASFCIPPYLYDAYMDRLDSADEFIAEMHRADRENKPLFLNIGMPWAARAYSPKMWALLTCRQLFEEPVQLIGYEPSLDRLVIRYKPRSAETFDFTAYDGRDR